MPSGPDTRRKIKSAGTLARLVARAKARGRSVVFTNGCFDLLHAGHVTLLERARRLGDLLIVGLNSDRSVRGLKGAGRPVLRQQDRARLLAALAAVDYVTIFNSPTPAGLIRRLKPSVLVKGADWQAGAIVGREAVERTGGRVARLPLVPGLSTSALIRRIRRGRSHHLPRPARSGPQRS